MGGAMTRLRSRRGEAGGAGRRGEGAHNVSDNAYSLPTTTSFGQHNRQHQRHQSLHDAGVYRSHASAVSTVAFDSTIGLVVSAGADGQLCVMKTLHSPPNTDGSDGNSGGELSTTTICHNQQQQQQQQLRLSGHTKGITRVSIASLDGQRLASASRDRTVRIWALDDDAFSMGRGHHQEDGSHGYGSSSISGNGAARSAVLGEHDTGVTGVALSDDGTMCLSGSRDGCVKLWDTSRIGTGAVVGVGGGASDNGVGAAIRSKAISRNVVTCMSWIPTTSLCAQSSEDKRLRVWDARNCNPVQTFPTQQYIHTSCDVHGNLIVTSSNGFGGNGCFATLWDRRQPIEPVANFTGHREGLTGAAFCGGGGGGAGTVGGRYIVTTSRDATIRVWDTAVAATVSNTAATTTVMAAAAATTGKGSCVHSLTRDTVGGVTAVASGTSLSNESGCMIAVGTGCGTVLGFQVDQNTGQPSSCSL